MTTKQTTSCVQTEQDPPSFLLKTQLNLRCVHISQVLIDFEDHIQVRSILLILAYRKFFFQYKARCVQKCMQLQISQVDGRNRRLISLKLQLSVTDILQKSQNYSNERLTTPILVELLQNTLPLRSQWTRDLPPTPSLLNFLRVLSEVATRLRSGLDQK